MIHVGYFCSSDLMRIFIHHRSRTRNKSSSFKIRKKIANFTKVLKFVNIHKNLLSRRGFQWNITLWYLITYNSKLNVGEV